MKQKEFVSYYRVSTQRQGTSGLGLAAQRHAVQNFLNDGQHKEIAHFQEIESRKRTDRPELNKALELCRKSKATLVIGTLDRLAGDAAFVLSLKSSGVEFTCADAPFADRFTIGILALCAERERERIALRTKDALAAARRRGVQLGNPKLLGKVRAQAIAANQARAQTFAAKLAPVIAEIRKAGVVTLRGIAQCLNARGFKTPMGRAFTRQAVARVDLALINQGKNRS